VAIKPAIAARHSSSVIHRRIIPGSSFPEKRLFYLIMLP